VVTVLAALLIGPTALATWRGDSTSVAVALSVGLGVPALSVLVVVVAVPSRIRTLTRLLGVDRVLGLHRWLGLLAVVLVGLHAVVAVVNHPALLDVLSAPPAARVAWAAALALLLVGVAPGRGRHPGAHYEWWTRLHVGLAAATLVLAGLHVVWLRHLVADPVMRVGLGVLAAALLGVLSHPWIWRPLFSRQGAYVVYGVRREGPRVVTLVLAAVHCRRGGMRFSPGQFVWLRRRRGVVGAEEHPFTIASSAMVTGRLELTVRDSGDFTRDLLGLPVGGRIWLDGPHGAFTADELAGPDHHGLVLIAGGVAITPMMSMLRTLADRGDARRHRLVVAERGDEPLFDDELTALGRRLDLEVTRLAGRRIDAALLAEVLPDPAGRERLDYFVCGSPSLLAGSLAALDQLAVPAVRVHTEQFGWTGALPVPVTPSPPPKAPHGYAPPATADPEVDGRPSPGPHARRRGRPGLGELVGRRAVLDGRHVVGDVTRERRSGHRRHGHLPDGRTGLEHIHGRHAQR